MRKHILFLLLCMMVFASCEQFDELESLEGVEYDATYALPLVDTRISLRELIENVEETTTILIDENGLVRFQYQGDVITDDSKDIFASIVSIFAFEIS